MSLNVDFRDLGEEERAGFLSHGDHSILARVCFSEEVGGRHRWACWTRCHDSFRLANLETFEAEFLPHVMEFCRAKSTVRVHTVLRSTPVLEKWEWWTGSSVAEAARIVLAAHVMLS